MEKIFLILKEQFSNIGIIYRISKYEKKASYQGHYLGNAWEILNPTIQILTFFVVFGLGLRGGDDVMGVSFIAWLMIGKSSWFMVNKSILGGSTSVQGKISMVSKMKFPISVLPAITVLRQISAFFVMLMIGIVSSYFSGIIPTIHWLQFFYYFTAQFIFLYYVGILTSTITILARDFHFILQAIMRMLMFISGVMMVVHEIAPGRIGWMLSLSPIFYLINGFRDTFLYQRFFWERGLQTMFFWTFTLLIALIGSHLHLKFRSRFMDFI